MEKDKTNLDTLEEISILTTDKHMRDIMRELEYCDEMLYTQNLPPCKYLEVLIRKETLIEMRDSYANWLNRKK